MTHKTDGSNLILGALKGFFILLVVFLSYFAVQLLVSFVLPSFGAELSAAAVRIIYVSVWVAGAFVVSLLSKRNFFEDYRFIIKKDKRQLALLPVCALLAFALGVSMNYVVGFFVQLLPTPEAWITANNESVSAAGKGGMLAVFIALYVAAPLSEEMVFRGWGFGALRKSCGFVISAIVTSLFFALAHGNILQGIYAFVAGMVFSIIIERSGSLITGVFAHAGFNISGALISVLLPNTDAEFLVIGSFAVLIISLTGILIAGGITDSEVTTTETEEDDEFAEYDAVE